MGKASAAAKASKVAAMKAAVAAGRLNRNPVPHEQNKRHNASDDAQHNGRGSSGSGDAAAGSSSSTSSGGKAQGSVAGHADSASGLHGTSSSVGRALTANNSSGGGRSGADASAIRGSSGGGGGGADDVGKGSGSSSTGVGATGGAASGGSGNVNKTASSIRGAAMVPAANAGGGRGASATTKLPLPLPGPLISGSSNPNNLKDLASSGSLGSGPTKRSVVLPHNAGQQHVLHHPTDPWHQWEGLVGILVGVHIIALAFWCWLLYASRDGKKRGRGGGGGTSGRGGGERGDKAAQWRTPRDILAAYHKQAIGKV